MNLRLRGIGVATPEHKLDTNTAVELAKRVTCRDRKQERLVEVIYRQSGIQQRSTSVASEEAYRWLPGGDQHPETNNAPPATDSQNQVASRGPTTEQRSQWYRDHAPPLAEKAARNALRDSGIPAKQISHLVTVSCTGFDAPGVDRHLIHELNLQPTTQRVHVGFMGCQGAINGLRVANALAADPKATVLMVAVELCSLHYGFQWNSQRVLANALFADGAGAIVGTGTEAHSAAAEPTDWRVAATGSVVLPDTTDLMSWRIGNHGFEMSLSSELPALIENQIGDWLQTWLGEQGVPADSVGCWAVHPGGPRILEAVETAMQLPREETEVSRKILAAHGNMSSATLLFVLQELQRQHAASPCVMIGFGPGIVAEVALLV